MEYSVLVAKPQDNLAAIISKKDIGLILLPSSMRIEILEKENRSLTEFPPLLLLKTDGEKEQGKMLPEQIIADYLEPPFEEKTLARKVKLLFQFQQLREELSQTRGEVSELREEIEVLKQSIDGHNSFIDLMSRRDGLTGLFNRRYFNTIIKELFDDALTSGKELSLAMLNVDLFSEINRTCSQKFGDFVLNELSARITLLSNEVDLCFRLSGEEFAVLMPETSADDAFVIAEKIRSSCEEKEFENPQFSKKVTVSAGIVSLQKHTPRSHEELVGMADQALFMAKSEGRNRSRIYDPIERDILGTSEKNFQILQDTIHRILGKTKIATVRSLQLLTHGIIEKEESGRIEKTQEFVKLLGEKLGFTPTLIEAFHNAITLLSSIRYLLHHEMISKKGKLNKQEWEVLNDFPYKASQLIELFEYFSREKSILLHHGERYDGNGYPEGLKGDQIPIGARIFQLANSFAAMVSDRPYRKKLSDRKALAELGSHAGTQFDPLLVMKLIDVVEEKGILKVSKEELDKTRKIVQKSISSE